MTDKFNKTYIFLRDFSSFNKGDKIKANNKHPCVEGGCIYSDKCRGSYGFHCIRLMLKKGVIKELADAYQYYLKQYY